MQGLGTIRRMNRWRRPKRVVYRTPSYVRETLRKLEEENRKLRAHVRRLQRKCAAERTATIDEVLGTLAKTKQIKADERERRAFLRQFDGVRGVKKVRY